MCSRSQMPVAPLLTASLPTIPNVIARRSLRSLAAVAAIAHTAGRFQKLSNVTHVHPRPLLFVL